MEIEYNLLPEPVQKLEEKADFMHKEMKTHREAPREEAPNAGVG